MVSFRREFKADWHRLPNLITGVRLVLCPVPGALLIANPTSISLRLLATFVFVVVVSTDAVDGYLARKRNEITKLGTLMDPLADKILILLTLCALSIVDPLILVPTIIIAMREVAVTRMRNRAKKRGIVISAVKSGKIKMIVQSVAISFLLLPLNGIWQTMTFAMLIVAAGVTIVSWVDYYQKFTEL